MVAIAETSPAVGILGGSFSPPHIGHVLAAHYALMRWPLKKILVVPSFSHPFGKPLPPFDHRLAMCRLAFAHLKDFVEICDVERDLGGVSYTVETVRELTKRNPDERYRLIVGGDILPDLPKWRQIEELTHLAPMLVIPRAKDGQVLGGRPDEGALPDVDSTAIRAKLQAGEMPVGTVPEHVMAYIRENDLYIDQ